MLSLPDFKFCNIFSEYYNGFIIPYIPLYCQENRKKFTIWFCKLSGVLGLPENFSPCGLLRSPALLLILTAYGRSFSTLWLCSVYSVTKVYRRILVRPILPRSPALLLILTAYGRSFSALWLGSVYSITKVYRGILVHPILPRSPTLMLIPAAYGHSFSAL